MSELYDRSEYTYDHKGRVTSIVRNENVYAGTQSVTTFTYAEDGSYVELEKRVETSASLNILSYEKELNYDAEGRLVRQYYKYPAYHIRVSSLSFQQHKCRTEAAQ